MDIIYYADYYKDTELNIMEYYYQRGPWTALSRPFEMHAR